MFLGVTAVMVLLLALAKPVFGATLNDIKYLALVFFFVLGKLCVHYAPEGNGPSSHAMTIIKWIVMILGILALIYMFFFNDSGVDLSDTRDYYSR